MKRFFFPPNYILLLPLILIHQLTTPGEGIKRKNVDISEETLTQSESLYVAKSKEEFSKIGISNNPSVNMRIVTLASRISLVFNYH